LTKLHVPTTLVFGRVAGFVVTV